MCTQLTTKMGNFRPLIDVAFMASTESPCAKQEGDSVTEFQQLCEVQSDKASVEITSQYEGTVTRLLHSEGDIVQVRRCSPPQAHITAVEYVQLARSMHAPKVRHLNLPTY